MNIDLKSIPKKRRRIVQYLLDNPDQVVINGSEALSKKLSVDRSTLINACKDLGHSGFKDYRKIISERIVNLGHKTPSFINEYKKPTPLQESIISSLAADLSAVEITSKKIDLKLIGKAVDLIFDSNIVYISALGYNGVIGEYLKNLLRTIKAGIININQYHGEVNDTINNISKKDIVISFAFDRVMSDCQKIFNAAKDKGAKTISITDSTHSSINEGADIKLLVNNPSRYFFSPHVATLSICNAIMHYAVEKNKPESIDKLRAYTKMADNSNVYV